MNIELSAANTLPGDGCRGTLVGRVRLDDGPHIVRVEEDGLFDITAEYPLMGELLEHENPAVAVRNAGGERLLSLDEVLGSPFDADAASTAVTVDEVYNST